MDNVEMIALEKVKDDIQKLKEKYQAKAIK